EADRLVTRIAPGVVSLVAELRGHERQAAEELEQWKTGVEGPKPLDASRRRSRWPRSVPGNNCGDGSLSSLAPADCLCRDCKVKEANRLVTRIDPGVVSLAAERRGHGRHAAKELGQWKTHIEERRATSA